MRKLCQIFSKSPKAGHKINGQRFPKSEFFSPYHVASQVEDVQMIYVRASVSEWNFGVNDVPPTRIQMNGAI